MNDCHIDDSGPFRFAGADLTDLVDLYIQKHRQTLPPLG
jgi:hypothetical protein